MVDERARLRASLGPVGVWSFALDTRPAAEAHAFAARLDELGYPALWVPESLGSKEIFAHASLLLAATERLVVCSGIANIWARDAVAMRNGGRVLAEAHPERFVLGIGVSHAPSVERRGHRYDRPLERMRAYLDGMDAAPYAGPKDAKDAPRLLAALGPRMLELSAERTAGAHSYFVPVEHTASARAVLGREPLLVPEQAVVLERDAGEARRVARGYMARYLELENYASNLRRLGWTDDDLNAGGSDRLVDAIVAWGDVDAIHRRVREHHDAGADHVPVQVLRADGGPAAGELEDLASALLP